MSSPGSLRVDFGVALDATGRDGSAFALAVDLEVAAGEVLAVVGPNGAGKSTLLRCVAGLTPIDRGSIAVGDRVLDEPQRRTWVDPDRRGIGLVFQDHVLFPHLSALDNVAFPARVRGRSRSEARAAAREWLERLGLPGQAGQMPRALSGGQAQRVALARSLASDPGVLLLDEPLSALDAASRAEVAGQLREHLAGFGGAVLLVSHDPLDAFVFADRVAVLEGGCVTQIGTIGEVAARPRSAYVADLLGVNLLAGAGDGHDVALDGDRTVVHTSGSVDGRALVLIRPRSVALHRARPETSARNVWQMTVKDVVMLGDRVRVHLGGELDLVAEVTPAAVADLGIGAGVPVWASVKASEVEAYPD
ncbi:MAG: ABC transporter ATP-binding protein [Microthrixaceae bacterium]